MSSILVLFTSYVFQKNGIGLTILSFLCDKKLIVLAYCYFPSDKMRNIHMDFPTVFDAQA